MINSNQTAGALVFLIWSVFCSWHYACNIKGLCSKSIATTEVIPSTLFIESPSEEINEIETTPTPEPVTEKLAEPVPEPIFIEQDVVYFNLNSSEIANPLEVEDFLQSLKKQIEGRNVAISIVGSTCDLGQASYNQKLGLKRAQAFKDFLESSGVNGSQIDVSSIGEIASVEGTEAEREKNRKVSITIKSLDT